MSNIIQYENYKKLLLVSWSNAMFSHMAKHSIPWTISWRDLSLNSSSVISNEMRMRILNRSSLVRCLYRKLFCCGSSQRFRLNIECQFLQRILHRLFTGAGHDSIARITRNPNFENMIHRQIVKGNEYLYSFVKIHPTLPIVARVVQRRFRGWINLFILSSDFQSVLQQESIHVSVSNERVVALHSFYPLLAITTGLLGRNIVIYQISLDMSYTSDVVERLIEHDQDITEVAFCKGTSNLIKIAFGDTLGSIRVYQMDVSSQNSSQCIGVLQNTPTGCYRYSNPITSINWSDGNRMILTNSNGKIWIIHAIDGQTWRIKTPDVEKSPPTLGTIFKNGIGDMYVTGVAFHPSGLFFATCSGTFQFKITKIQIWDVKTLESLSTYISPFHIFSMKFNIDGTMLFVGGPKETLILDVSSNGRQLNLISRYGVGHTRYISSVEVRHTHRGMVLLSADLTGLIVASEP
jgi:WD40 repeat protein